MRNYDIDLAIARIASRQHGAFSRHQAVSSGATPDIIDHRVSKRLWLPIDNGVFAFPSHAGTWQQRFMAATLGEVSALVSGKAAAALHGFVGFRPGRPEITVPKGSNHVSRIARIRQSDLVEPRRLDGIPVNSPTLTLFEIAGRVPARFTEAALEGALRTGALDLSRLTNQFVKLAHSRRPGLPVMRALLDARGDTYLPAASELEQLLYDTFDVPEFGPFIRQSRFPWRPRDLERCDGLIELGDIIVEADGRPWHSQLSDMERDRKRDRDAIEHGYLPLRWTYFDLKHDGERARETVRAIQRRLNVRVQPAA